MAATMARRTETGVTAREYSLAFAAIDVDAGSKDPAYDDSDVGPAKAQT